VTFQRTFTRVFVTVATASLLGSVAGHGAVIPYTEIFDDDATTTSGTATPSEPAPESGMFTPISGIAFETPDSVDSAWDVVLDGDHKYVNVFSVTADQNGDGSDGGASEAYLEVENLYKGVGGTFSVSYDFEISNLDVPGTQSRTGFDLLASSSGIDGGGNGYRVMYQTTGGATGDLFFLGGPADDDVSGTLTVSESVTYTLTIDGSFTAGGLNLSATLEDGTGSITETLTDPTPTKGNFFGFRTLLFDRDVDATPSTIDLAYNNFSFTGTTLAAVPEPSSALLLLLGGLAIAYRRRR
jgi:hypothetical protein